MFAAVVSSMFLLPLAPEGASGDRMTPELLWELARVGGAQVSPDGTQVLLRISRYDLGENAGHSELYLVPVSGGPGGSAGEPRQLTAGEKSPGSAAWAPDGGSIAFVSDRGKGTQIFRLPLAGGEARALCDVPEGATNLRWSPDGKHFSFTAPVELDAKDPLFEGLEKADARIIDDLLYRRWDSWRDGSYQHVFVVPVAGGEPLDLMSGQKLDCPLQPFGGVEDYEWSPDGAELCYTTVIAERPEASTDSDLFLVPVGGGAAKNVTEGMDGYDRHPVYSPDGRWMAFNSMARAGYEADRDRLMLRDRESGEVRELSRGFDANVLDFVWDDDSRGGVFASEDKGSIQIFTIDLEGKVRRVTSGQHNLTGPLEVPGRKMVVAARSTHLAPAELVRVDLADGTITELTHVNAEILAGLELPTSEERWIESTDGARMQMWVIKPPDFDPSVKYPLLTYCQGGPQSMVSQFFSYRWNFHLMAAQGYVVVAPNRRGLPGFGSKWNEDISQHWGEQAMQDYLAATDAMFAEPWIDRARTAAIGASFGGYSVYWLMGHDQEDRFASMIAHAGVFNLESMYGATEELFFVNWDMGGPYWTSEANRQRYAAHSPHRSVQNWDTPLLVVHGQKDFRVPVTEGMQAFTAAQVRGVKSRFLYYPEEGHWVLSPQNGVLWHRVFFDWLEETLPGGS